MVKTFNPENTNKPAPRKLPIIYTLNVETLTDKKTGLETAFNLTDSLYNFIFDNYKRKDQFIRVEFGGYDSEHPAKFVMLTCSELLMHLSIWFLHVIYSGKLKRKVHIEEDDFFSLVPFNSKLFSKIMNHCMEKFIGDVENIQELSFYSSYIIQFLVELAEGYSTISCNTISLYDIIQLEKRSKEFRDCINTRLDDTLPIKDIEKQIANGQKRVMAAITEDAQSALYPYVLGQRMSPDQFTQMFYAVGPRTDIDKTILPMIMRGNFLKGYDCASSYYIDAITGRDAQIVKHTNVRDSGYLSRKINLACLNTEIDYSVKDCGTSHYLIYHVVNEDFLKSIGQKYQILDNGKLHEINVKKDTHLIGQTIKLRTHIGCALEHGKVCQTCFGGKSKRVKGTRIGGLPSIKLANVLSKRIMKAKHFTTTNSIEVDQHIIGQFFEIESNKFFLRKDINAKNLYIVVDREYVEEIVEGNVDFSEEGTDAVLPLESIRIRNDTVDTVIECDGMFLTLTDEVLEHSSKFLIDLDSDDALIPLSKLDPDAPLFNMVIITEEVSRYLKKVKKEIDTSKIREYKTYSDFVNALISILIESGMIGTSITHIETMAYNLVRQPEKLYLRPDFKNSTQESIEYSLVPMSQSILKSDLYTALAFQEFKSQMKDADSFNKNLSGIFDDIFKAKKPEYLKKIPREFLMASLAG